MNTRLLMITSALVMAAIGLSLSFAPGEVFSALGGEGSGQWIIVLQLCGALYCGFAFLNWTAKGAVLGGIYGRPVVIGNLVHYTMGALALLKAASGAPTGTVIWILAIVYTVFAASFGYVMYTHPTKTGTGTM